jgi:hypothetical protein
MNLSDAITAVETASSAYSAAATTTTNDQATADAVQAKLDAAKAQVGTDQVAQADAGSAFNASLDALIAAATAAKIPAPTVTVTT